MKAVLGLSAISVFIYTILKESEDESMKQYFFYNTIVQTLLFVFVACIPCVKTGLMKNVDIAWPWGLVVMGVFSLYFGTTSPIRKLLISTCYLLQGLRMGAGGTPKILKMKVDFPRYDFVKIILDKKGVTSPFMRSFYQVSDILAQCAANIGVLSVPIFLTSFQKDDSVYISEFVCFVLFFVYITLETKADIQKKIFIKRNQKVEGGNLKVCQEGLWKYSRHPNYFFELMIWINYGIWSLINLSTLYTTGMIHTCVTILWSILIVIMCFTFYWCLLVATGAAPAEYFSKRKRPDYKDYMERTNKFIPWFPKQKAENKKKET